MTVLPRRFRPLLFGVVAVAATACSLLSGPPTRNLYQVTPATGFPTLPRAMVQLRVDTPTASAGLDTDRIALSRSPVSLDYFADAAWADRLPEMVRTALVESFENSGAVEAVGSSSFSLRADFELKPEIREFTAVYDSPAGSGARPTATVVLALKLIKMPDRTIVAQTSVSEREAAASNEVPAIAVALNTAFGRAMRQAVVWTVSNPALSVRRR